MTEDVRLQYQDAVEYDATNQKEDDLPFWAEACRRYWPKSVLELAVGTGRVAIPLARQGVSQGFAVTGIDITEEMLSRGREKLVAEPAEAQAKLTLVHGDIRHFELGQQFDLVFIAYNSILHLLTIEDRLSAFGCAYRHTAAGGYFLVDVFNPSLLLLSQAQEPISRVTLDQDVEDEALGRRLIRTTASRYDETTQTMRSRRFIERYRKGRRQDKRFQEAAHHIYFPEELRLLLLMCGFSIEEVFGGYAWEPFVSGSARAIFIGRKG